MYSTSYRKADCSIKIETSNRELLIKNSRFRDIPKELSEKVSFEFEQNKLLKIFATLNRRNIKYCADCNEKNYLNFCNSMLKP